MDLNAVASRNNFIKSISQLYDRIMRKRIQTVNNIAFHNCLYDFVTEFIQQWIETSTTNNDKKHVKSCVTVRCCCCCCFRYRQHCHRRHRRKASHSQSNHFSRLTCKTNVNIGEQISETSLTICGQDDRKRHNNVQYWSFV